jgi:hypothetical protein
MNIMRIRTIANAILLVITLWPIIFFVYVYVFIYDEYLAALLIIARPETATPEKNSLLLLHILTLVLFFCTFGYYSYRLFHDQLVPQEKKVTWFFAFIILTSLAFLAYWMKYIMKPEKPRS